MVRLVITIIISMAIVILSSGPTICQTIISQDKNVTGLSQQQHPADQAEMEAFLDELLKRQMEENHIAGAAVAVVKDGALFFAKGYGYSDLENKIPVDARLTLFRIGSVTKLFTWTAVMQLIEKGNLFLDADVNTYLDFHIPDTYAQPVTLRHLLTHTAGFEDLHIEMVTLREDEIAPPREWLVSHLPERVFPPGEMAAYSNYGAALAGYIVSRVSGQSYIEYVQQNIFDPLGMNNSAIQWPTPYDLKERESVGYMYKDDSYRVFPNLMSPLDLFPAGGIRSTVTDMSRFMIAHLGNGIYIDSSGIASRILEETTAQQMHSTLYTPDPHILGITYGFFNFSDNGQVVIGHSGSAEPMQSLLLLLPERKVGVFVAYNSLGAIKLCRQHFGFQREFFDHYYPAPEPEPIQPPEDFNERADGFVGTYRMTWHAYSNLEKFMSLMNPAVEVKNPGDGTLLLISPYGNWRIIEKDPMYFRQANGPFGFAFRKDEKGRIANLFTDFTPMMSFEKSKWFETQSFNLTLLMVCLPVFLIMLPIVVTRLIRWRRNRIENPGLSDLIALWLIMGISFLNILLVAGNIIWGEQVVFGIPLAYKIVLGFGVISALLTAGALVYMIVAWKNRYWSIAFTIYYTIGTVSAVAFLWFLNNWNLLGWQF